MVGKYVFIVPWRYDGHMQFWDKVLKLLARIFRVVNKSSSLFLVILIGSIISLAIFWDIVNRPDVAHRITLVSIVVLLPFLMYKMFLYFLLTLFDFILIANTDYDKVYEVDMEKVRARVLKVMEERKVRYQSLEAIALGMERKFLTRMRGFLHLKFPLIYVATDKPFVVIKIFRTIESAKVANLVKQVENKDRVGIRIFTEETAEAKVLAKVIINSLEFLNKEGDAEEGMETK